MKYLKGLALSAAIAGVASTVDAATVTFDFTGPSDTKGAWSGTQSSLTYTVAGISLTVTSQGGAGKVETWGSKGLGAPGDDYHFVDSSGSAEDSSDSAETVIFNFSRLVSLAKVTFSYVDPWDGFKLTEEGTSLGVFDVLASVGLNTGKADTFGIGAVGSVTRYWSEVQLGYDQACTRKGSRADPPAYRHDCYSAFKITSLTVEYDDPPPVPLPAAGWMVLVGLAGLAAVRRRR